jgi:dihydrodipicolinate synthase/N-acetylneuraminate lyase
MNQLRYLRGSIVAIVTPFTDNGSIDFEVYEALVKRQLKGGTNAIVVAGTTGESAPLSSDEYADLIRFTVKIVNGEVPVIVGAGSNVTQRAIQHSLVAKRGFKVYSGDDAMALSIIAAGGDGCISVVANQVPQEFSRMINAALENDIVLARQLHYRLLNLMNYNFIESNPIPVKTCLYMMGMLKNNFRAPIYPMEDQKNLEILRNELSKLGLLSLDTMKHPGAVIA